MVSHSYTFTLTGQSSELTCSFYPSISLRGDIDYELALLNFDAYNSIANVTEENNLLHYGEKDEKIEIPIGSYDVADIAAYILEEVKRQNPSIRIVLRGNPNTQTVDIKSSENLHFEKDRSIGSLLGFGKRKLNKDVHHIGEYRVNINAVNALQIYCSLINGSYNNGQQVHVLHHFFPNVPPGFKIIENPQPPIYLPVLVKDITNISIKVLDQHGRTVKFGEKEEITIRIHLREVQR